MSTATILTTTIALLSSGAAARAISAEAWARASAYLPANSGKLSFDTDIQATWIPDADVLWYKTSNETGWTFMLAEPATKRKRPAFDAAAMAASLSRATGMPVDARHLPITKLSFPAGPSGPPRVVVTGKTYDCDLANSGCALAKEPARDPTADYSSDGKRAVFAKGPNLWVRDTATGAERPLTTDGEPHKGYGASAEGFVHISRERMGLRLAPVGDFSPDGTRFVTYQLDESRAKDLDYLQFVPEDGSIRPKILSYRASLPSDAPATATMVILDLVSGAKTAVDHPPITVRDTWPIGFEKLTWSADGRSVYFVDYSPDYRVKSLFRTDALSGSTKALIVEAGAAGQVSLIAPGFRLLKTGEILWPSERDGWEHLYLFRPDGVLERRLTDGDWLVRDILRVDETSRAVVFAGAGRLPGQDPYYRHVYRVGLDGRGLQDLTPQDADHEGLSIEGAYFVRNFATHGGFSDDGRWFVDAYSRVDLPTNTVIRDRDGHEVMSLAVARPSETARSVGYAPPERIKVMAADGVTPIYCTLTKPSDFDPAKRYPVIDSIYDGPQSPVAATRFMWDALKPGDRSLAELGFIVVVLDGRGKPERSRAFWEYGYGQLGRGGLPDHVAGLKQLAAARPYMDADRIGAYGYSGGGFATVHAMLDDPDVYKVGVAISPYSLMYSDWSWGEAWQGPYDPVKDLAQEPWVNAANLKGKLFFAIGDIDDVVHPSSAMRIADALIKHDKPFDMMVVPNADHQLVATTYMQERVWDYFVRNLLSAEPPTGH